MAKAPWPKNWPAISKPFSWKSYERQRAATYDRLRDKLDTRQLPYVVINGGYEERTQKAITAVEAMLAISTGTP